MSQELKQRTQKTIENLDKIFKQSESILKEFHPIDVVETYSSYDMNGKFLKEIQQLLKELVERDGKMVLGLKEIGDYRELVRFNKDRLLSIADMAGHVTQKAKDVLEELGE